MSLPNATLEVLAQLSSVISHCSSIYTVGSVGSPIGKHVRHILDHFDALIDGLDSGFIDYNKRTRNSRCEIDTAVAFDRLSTIRNTLAKLGDLEIPVAVVTEVSIHQKLSKTINSNFERELAYVESHTIHHLAYIKLIAKYLNVEIDASVGIAPATATYLRSQ